MFEHIRLMSDSQACEEIPRLPFVWDAYQLEIPLKSFVFPLGLVIFICYFISFVSIHCHTFFFWSVVSCEALLSEPAVTVTDKDLFVWGAHLSHFNSLCVCLFSWKLDCITLHLAFMFRASLPVTSAHKLGYKACSDITSVSVCVISPALCPSLSVLTP